MMSTTASSGPGRSKTLNGPNHEEWVRQKERERDDQKHLATLQKRKEKRLAEKTKEAAQATFDSWVKKKSRYEKVLRLLAKTNVRRASDEKTWREVGIALVATDCLVGTYDLSEGNPDLPTLVPPKPTVKPGGKVPASQKPLPSLMKNFITWSRATSGEPRHCYEDVVIPIEKASLLSNAVQELAEDYGRIYTHNKKEQGSDVDDDDGGGEDSFWTFPTNKREKTKYVLNSLQYTPPLGRPARTPLEAVMEASNGVLNGLWNKRTKWFWKKCQEAVIKRVQKRLSNNPRKTGKGAGTKDDSADEAEVSDEEEDVDESPEETLKRMESILMSMSVGKLTKWIEEDAIEAEDAQRMKEKEDRAFAKKTHEGWKKKKNENIIILPEQTDEDVAKMKRLKKSEAPRMDFSGRGVIRPKKINVAQNSVDMMLDSGLRVIHANPRSRRDLEDARSSLLDLGYVNKQNFRTDFDSKGRSTIDKDQLEREKKKNPALVRVRQLKEEKARRNNGEDYTVWEEQKGRVARAKKCLSCIDRPFEGENKSDDPPTREERWKEVGRNLKGVDSTLCPQFAEWSKGYKTFGECQAVWKGFDPKDIKLPPKVAMAMELTKDTILKIVKKRRQFDWAAAFEEKFNEKLRRLEDRDEKRYQELKKAGVDNMEMQPKALQSFFNEHGIALTGPEIKSMFAAFDENENGKLSAKEFRSFADGARTNNINPNSDFWMDLPTLKKYKKEQKIGRWGDTERQKCVEELESLAQDRLDAEAEVKMLEKGKPPSPPVIKIVRSNEQTPEEQTCSLQLEWAPGPGLSLPIFYVLEKADKSGKVFEELIKDPPHAKHKEIVPTGRYLHEGLRPNSKYQYRLTAFNGFGPSTPTYASFTTLPIAPPQPRLESSAMTIDKCSVVISWGEGAEYVKKMKELRRIFDDIDTSDDGALSRKEFNAFRASFDRPRIREFLEWSGCTEEVFETLWDADEDADGVIRFDEFCRHFLRHAIVNSNKPKVVDGECESKIEDDHAAVATGLKFVLMQCIADEDAPFYSPVTAPTHKTSWKVSGLVPGQSYQYCVHAVNQDGEPGPPSKPLIVNAQLQQPDPPSVKQGKNGKVVLAWKDAPNLDMSSMLLGNGSATPSRQDANGSTLNKSKLRKSGSHASTAPKEKDWGGNPLAASMTFNKGVSGTQSTTWMKKLAEWTNPTDGPGKGSDETYSENGVSKQSVKRMFERYDKDRSGSLDIKELKDFLKDLGMPSDTHAVDEVMRDMDTDADQQVNLGEFTRWWLKHEVTFVLKRDQGTPESSLALTGGRVPGKPYYNMSYTSKDERSVTFRVGDDSDYGLKPNTMYRFALQLRSRRSFSPLSQEVQVCTPPGAPTQPMAVSVRSREVTLKWYPGPGGAAFKYVVFYKKIGKITRGVAIEEDTNDDGWDKCFEGSTTLARISTGIDADTAYRFKVAALNRQFTRGAFSLSTLAVTIRSADDVDTTPSNVEDIFTVECTGDVVTGDTIVFTERVFRVVKPETSGKENSKNRKSKTVLRSSGSKKVSSTSRSGVNDSTGSIRLSQSIDGGAKREFVTERTSAAVVFKEAFEEPKRKGSTVKERVLTMQVVWCIANTKGEVAKKHLLQPGALITRKENDLREFEVFRCPWAQEDSRWTASEEQTARVLDEGLASGDMV